MCEREAFAQAEDADRRLGGGQAPALCGIPLAIKDIFATRGVRTTCASRILENFVPPYDATVIAQAPRGRAPCSSARPTWTSSRWARRPRTRPSARPRNPWDLGRVAGGSSGGSAAAVAADECLGRARHRHRRLDSPAGGVLRRRRHQADLRPRQPLRRDRLRLVARSGRAVRQDRARRRAHAATRSPGTTRATRPAPTRPVPDYERSLTGEVKGHAARRAERILRRRDGARSRGRGPRRAQAARSARRARRSKSRCRTPSTRSPPTI